MAASEKSLSKKLESLIEKIDERIEQRNEIFNNRTENWQESERGEWFDDKTIALETVRDDLDSALWDLKSEFDIE